MDTEVFRNLGFTEGEIKVYLAIIELGESSIGPLSKRARVTPAKTYPILEKLKEKGLITSIIKSGTTYFQAFNPNRILAIIDEKRKDLSERESKIKEIIPKLQARQKIEATQSARIYEGYKGLKTFYEETIDYLKKSKEEFKAFTLGEEYKEESLMRFFDHYDNIRRELKIKTKLIGIKKQKEFFDKLDLKKRGIEIKYLPYKSLPQGVIIAGDNVATMVWGKNPMAFVINSKITAEAYKKFFEEIWKRAKP